MTKTILLLRHGKSDWSVPGRADFDRPLAKRGKKDAPRMGQVLTMFDSVPDIILSSPAKRAKQTAKKTAKACGYTDPIQWAESFYGGDSDDLIVALQRLPAPIERPMLVGHNPTMEETISVLLCGEVDSWQGGCEIRFPTAALVCLDVDIYNWSHLRPGDATLRWYLIPKLVKAIQA